jgi:hypothetical protein
VRRLIQPARPARVPTRLPSGAPTKSIKQLFEEGGRKGFTVVDDKTSWTWNKPKAKPEKAPEPKE